MGAANRLSCDAPSTYLSTCTIKYTPTTPVIIKTSIIGVTNSIPIASTETFSVSPSEIQCPPIKYTLEIYAGASLVTSSPINNLIEMIDLSFYAKGL